MKSIEHALVELSPLNRSILDKRIENIKINHFLGGMVFGAFITWLGQLVS